MRGADVAPALQERLGPEGTAGLLDLFDTARQEWTADVMAAAEGRFERRLTEEMSGMRVALAQTEASLRQTIVEGDAALRQEMTEQGAALRQEIAEQGATLRKETSDLGVALRREMGDQGTALRQEIGDLGVALRREFGDRFEMVGHQIASLRQEQQAARFELLKWAFAFWVGQVFAVAGIVALMLRLVGSPR